MGNARIKIKYKKLGREKIWGHADSYPLEIDSRVIGKKKMEIIIHESLHYLLPDKTEEQIEGMAVRLTKTLWHEKFRQVDNFEGIKMQDGSN